MKLPRVTTTERNNLVYLEPGSIIWNSTDGQIQYWNSGWNALTQVIIDGKKELSGKG